MTLGNQLVRFPSQWRGGNSASRKVVHAEDQRSPTLEVRAWFCQPADCASCNVSHSTVADYLQRAEAAALNSWPLPVDLDETGLEARRFAPIEIADPSRSIPNWAAINEELHGHKHVTLQLVWQEYKQDEPGA